jgi:Ice-binding-like
MCFLEKQRPFLPVTAIALLLSIASFQTVSAATAPSLGTAASFAVLGASAVTNTGPTVINGNLGVSPGTAVTGFPPGIVVPPGTIHAADAAAAGAQSDNTIAYNALAGQVCNFNLTGQDLGGLTLSPGVYCFSSSAQLTGTLTLNAQGNSNAVFIFQIGSTLTTASNSSVNIINGGSACNLFWQVGSSATLGTTTSFIGNILALTSITLNTGAGMSGRALAQTGAVTMDSNIVSITECSTIFIAQPTIVKVFGAAAIGVGGTTTLSYNINNPNATVALTGVAFTDTLPAGLAVSTPNNGLTGSCGAGTITAVAGSGSVSLTGATLAGGASCTFSVNVTGTTAGVKNNSVTVTSTNGGTGNTSTALLNVVVAVVAPPTISKSFGTVSISSGGTTALSFTINNPNATVALTGVAFTDTLPAGLVVATPNGLTGSCGGGIITVTPGSGSISLIGATLPAGASCTFSVNVTATIDGVLTNITGNVTSSNGGLGNSTLAQVLVGTGFLVRYAANLQAGESVINITNTGANGASLLGPGFGRAVGNICVNVYAFSPDEQLVSCCSCLLTPNQVSTLGVNADLLYKTLTGAPVTSTAIKLVSTLAGDGSGTSCTNSAAKLLDTTTTIVPGMLAWGTTLHAQGAAFVTTEAPFLPATLSAGEKASISGRCAAIIGNGSTYGICKSCVAGAQGAPKM